MFFFFDTKPKYYEIGETYLKFDFEFDDKSKFLIKEIYQKKIKGSSNEILRISENIKISIEFEKGSLKTKIKIWGLATTLYIGIGQYGSFKQGIREVISDVRSLSENFINNFSNDHKIGHNRVIRFEKRTGIIGRINDIYTRIDRLEKQLNTLSHNEITDELNAIKQEVSNILVLIPTDVQNEFLDDIANNYKDNLPEPNEKRVNYLVNRYGLKPEDETKLMEEN